MPFSSCVKIHFPKCPESYAPPRLPHGVTKASPRCCRPGPCHVKFNLESWLVSLSLHFSLPVLQIQRAACDIVQNQLWLESKNPLASKVKSFSMDLCVQPSTLDLFCQLFCHWTSAVLQYRELFLQCPYLASAGPELSCFDVFNIFLAR